MPWQRTLARRAITHCAVKAISLTVFFTGFMAAYIWVARHPSFPVRVVPYLAFDRLIGFHSWSLFLYVSFWIYLSIAPILIEDLRQLAIYWLTLGAVGLAGLLFFVLWPNRLAPPDPSWTPTPLFAWLRSVDLSGNACPSLHAAFTVFTAVVLGRELRLVRAPALPRSLNLFWCLGILYSTLATKQHGVIDLLAGTLLGLAGAAIAGIRWLRLSRPGESPA